MGVLIRNGIRYSGGGGSSEEPLYPRLVIHTEHGSTVTVTYPDGTTTITPEETSSGYFECDVTEYGIYTIDAILNEDDAQYKVTVNDVKIYTIDDTHYHGSIIVTYSSGATCRCYNTETGENYYASSSPYTFAVHHPVTYTITSTLEGEVKSATITMTTEGQSETVDLSHLPNGETVTPTDDIQIWLKCADITDKSYTTLNEVLADSVTFNALLGDSNASAYMARSTTWTTDICADQYAMNLLGQYDTACDALLSDSTWASAIANSTYFESVLNVKVPTMTGATTPEGEAFASTNNTNAYKAFDGNIFGSWDYTFAFDRGDTFGSAYFGYDFGAPVRITKFVLDAFDGRTGTYKICGSNDKSTWVDLTSTLDGTTGTSITQSGWSSLRSTVTITDNGNYRYYALFALTSQAGGTVHPDYFCTLELQFYGRASSSEKVHGGNGDTFYHIVDGNHILVTDPATLDAGVYTIYSNGLAKNPSDLTADYGKQVRICKNTKEIVVRPDNALYWYGWEGKDFEFGNVKAQANAYSPIASHTKNTNNIQLQVADSGSGISVAGQNVSKVLDLSDVDSIKTILSFNSGSAAYSTRMCVTPTALTSIQYGTSEHYLSSFTIPTYSVATNTSDFAGVYDTPKLETMDVSNLSTGQIVQGVSGGVNQTRGISTLYAVWKE